MLFVVFVLSLVGSTLTSSLSKRGGGHHVPLINCPTCEHHVCDFHNLMQCEVCQIVIPHENQPPESVKCAHANHCHEDQHHHCCANEGCVAHFLGQSASSAVTQPALSMECPHCHEGICDFINRDHCSTCKIDLHDGKLPHAHCLKETDHCDPNHHICCSDEPCIAQAFGHYYPTSHSPNPTTQRDTTPIPTHSSTAATTTQPHSSNSTLTTTVRTTNTSPLTNPASTDGYKMNQTNQLLGYIQCPVCSHHHICDPTNTNLCEACKITFDKLRLPQKTECNTVEHCHDDNGHICCTDMACVENVFGPIPKSSNGNKIYCPDCSKHGCDFMSCETCVYGKEINHDTLMHPFKTCELKEECKHHDVICCHDHNCIEELHFQITLPTSQSTSIPSFTSKPTDRASTTKEHTASHAITSNASAAMTTTKGQTTTTDTATPNIATSVSSNDASTPTIAATMTTKKGQSTTRDITMPNVATSVSSNDAHTISIAATTTTTKGQTTTTDSTTPNIATSVSSNGTNNSCFDKLNNCAMFKSMGVCHASPQEGTKYEIAFQCKFTCDRCNETYTPLTTISSTIPTTIGPTKAPIRCQICGDYDNDISCDLVSVYKGPFVDCTEGAYCMNDIVHEQGNVKTFKRCVNETVCRNLWMSQTSDQDHCTNYGNVVASGDYSCHFCCTTDRCNLGLLPDPSTYYIKA